MGFKRRRRSPGLARFVDWLRDNLPGRAFRRFAFNGPAPAIAIDGYEEATGRSGLGEIGWSRYDGQARPTELRVDWLPGGARWLPVGTARGFCRFNPYPDGVLFAASYADTFLTLDRAGRVVFDDWRRQRRAILGASLEALIDRYLELLEAGELVYSNNTRAISAPGRELWRALAEASPKR
jgi:hypothetical protein